MNESVGLERVVVVPVCVEWREGGVCGEGCVVNESVGLEMVVVVLVCVEWREGGVCGERVW